jgi:hypothetical protein
MSLRIQMLQVARRGVQGLGESADLVRRFLTGCLNDQGAGLDRDGCPDLYYTIFAVAGLQALDEEVPHERIRGYLRGFGAGEGLDFVHVGALARCWAAVGGMEQSRAQSVLERLETFRARDGGYDAEPGSLHGNAYGCFVALGAYQDLGGQLPDALRLVHCLKHLETPDGAWGNAPGLPLGSTNATAAAVVLLHQLGMPVSPGVGAWLRGQAHPQGGFLAMPKAPFPDLLSTATTLHALACLDEPLREQEKERGLEFLDSLWTADGGFHGHWADDCLDAEYTFYGLLALGHLV